MKYLQERKLAQGVMIEELGFAPKLENIIPLESYHNGYGYCSYVLFEVKNSKKPYQYRAYRKNPTSKGELNIEEVKEGE